MTLSLHFRIASVKRQGHKVMYSGIRVICDPIFEDACIKEVVYDCWCWLVGRFAGGVVYFGLSLSTSTLAGNKYINFFLSGAVEAPAYGLTVVVLQKSVYTIRSTHFEAHGKCDLTTG